MALLTADKNMEQALVGLLDRPQALGLRPIRWEIFVHPRRDPGCLNEAHTFLRPLTRSYGHALALFDQQGCGRESTPAERLADEVAQRLNDHGWEGRAAAVVVAPELEIWVWSNSPQVATCLGWPDETTLRAWLADGGHWPAGQAKPPDPKRAMEAALRQAQRPRSSAIYRELAGRVSLRGHNEPAFVRLTTILQGWFPA